MAAEGLGLFQNAPTPDWKDGRKPVPTKGRNGAGRAPRNPGKRVCIKKPVQKKKKLKNYLRSIDAGEAAVILSMIMLTSSTRIPV